MPRGALLGSRLPRASVAQFLAEFASCVQGRPEGQVLAPEPELSTSDEQRGQVTAAGSPRTPGLAQEEARDLGTGAGFFFWPARPARARAHPALAAPPVPAGPARSAAGDRPA